MKVCCSCHELKPRESFNLRRRSKDGLQSRCRECCSAWYARHAVQHKVNVAARNERERHEIRQRIMQHFLDHPCTDCGEADVRCLEFDHRPGEGKRANIGDLMRSPAPWRTIEAEIAKCDVRCANCHRRRTAERGAWWREEVQQGVEAARAAAAAARLRALTPTRG